MTIDVASLNGRHPTSFEPIESILPEKPIRPFSSYSKEELKEATSYIEDELSARFKKAGKNSSITQFMIEITAIFVLLSASSKVTSRKAMWDLIPEIIEQTKINAATYNSKVVWICSMGGAAVSALGGAASLGSYAAGAMELQTANLMFQTISGTGQVASTFGQLWGQKETGIRTIGEMKVTMLNMHKERMKEVDSAEARKTAEMAEQIMRIIQSHHDTASRILGG